MQSSSYTCRNGRSFIKILFVSLITKLVHNTNGQRRGQIIIQYIKTIEIMRVIQYAMRNFRQSITFLKINIRQIALHIIRKIHLMLPRHLQLPTISKFPL